ncbi:MAG: hypothetical protein K8T10_07210 [Candidatus Eremiobacteraeota bacterium]|nr:hypothetical protein [Candidatus Eremiobacteraeota bacterium]
MKSRVPRTYSAELGGGNIHELSSGFMFWRKYWYTNNLMEDLCRKFHKTQRRKEVPTLERAEFHKVAEFIFEEANHQTVFVGLSSKRIVEKLKIDYRYLKLMCEKDLLQRGFHKPKELKKFLNWEIKGIDEVEVMFPTRRLVTVYFVKKERSGESRVIRSADL